MNQNERNKDSSATWEILETKGLSSSSCCYLACQDSLSWGKNHVTVMNQLGNHRILSIHCHWRDDDLGFVVLPDGGEFEWTFSINFWDTTLFYCNVQWDQSRWHHFDAYASEWDSDPCLIECNWMISKDGLLLNYNPELRNWDVVPFQDRNWYIARDFLLIWSSGRSEL